MIANATLAGPRRLLVSLLLIATAGLAQAATPLGEPFKIGTQVGISTPAVARSASGGFVVAWDAEQGTPGHSRTELLLQRFNASGSPLGSAFSPSPAVSYSRRMPTVAMNASGSFVVAWVEETQYSETNLTMNYYAQRFSASGAPIGAVQLVAQSLSDQVEPPSVAMAADGSYVVAWQAVSYSTSLPNPLGWIHTVTARVHARQYSADGLPRGKAITVDTGVPVLPGFIAKPSNVAVGVDASGSFTVAFESWLGQSRSIQLRRYSPEGIARGLRVRVSQLASFWGSQPSLLVNADGSSVVAWTGCNETSLPGCKSYFQRFGADGRKQGDITGIVHPDPTVGTSNPRLAGGPNGAFLVLSRARLNGKDWSYGQAYTAGGTPEGAGFKLRPSAPPQGEDFANLASDANGDFVATWRDVFFEPGTGLYGTYTALLQGQLFLRQ